MTRLRRWRFHQLGSQAGQAGPGQEGPAGGGQEGERWMMRRAGPSGWELLAAAGRVSSSGTVVPQVPAPPEVARVMLHNHQQRRSPGWRWPVRWACCTPDLTWVSMSARMKVGGVFFDFSIWSKFVSRKHFVLSTYELGVSDSQFSVQAV